VYDRNRLGQMILEHWKKYRPQMVEDLRRANQLDQAIYEVQERTGDLLYELVSVQKMDYHAAWEIATREWAFLQSQNRPQSSSAASTPTSL
jgi:tRNA(Ile)-lysidine synthase TilS/MesJ